MRSTAKRFVVVMMAMAMVVALPAVALAHHPEITATPDCMLENGDYLVDITAYAWAGNAALGERTNPNIGIYLDLSGAPVATGAFNAANGYTFTRTITVPEGTGSPVMVYVRADAAWDSGHPAGDVRSTEVALPTKRCVTNPGTGTPGYWHKLDRWVEWKIDAPFVMGGVEYSHHDAIAWLNKPVKGDKRVTMARALIAAKLNVEIGNASWCVDETIEEAEGWWLTYRNVDPVKANSYAWGMGGPLASMLDDYNNGRLCAPYRG